MRRAWDERYRSKKPPDVSRNKAEEIQGETEGVDFQKELKD